MGQKIFAKRAGEEFAVSLDMALPLGTETIQSVTSTVDTGLTKEGNPTFDGTWVYQVVSGGTLDNYYLVTWAVVTNSGSTINGTVIVRIVADTKPRILTAATALVGLEETKTFIGKVSDEDTGVIEQIIDGVSQAFNAEVGFTLAQTTYLDYYLDGNARPALWLPAAPVTAITTLYEDGVLLTEGEDKDFRLYGPEGKLLRLNGVWFAGPKTVKVSSFTAGYVCLTGTITLPAQIRLAALKQAGYEFSRYMQKDWGVENRTLKDGSSAVTQAGLLEDVKDVLKYYRRVEI